jgi:hypothetical protein
LAAKAALLALIAVVDGLDSARYTPASWDRVVACLVEARLVAGDAAGAGTIADEAAAGGKGDGAASSTHLKRFKAGKPKIAGAKAARRTLRVKAGTWVSKAKLSYQWYRDGKAIAKATKAAYKITARDKGKRITVRVTANKAGCLFVAGKSAAVRSSAGVF